MRCKAHNKHTGEPCGSYAVKGKEVCRMHGAFGGRPIKHGRYSNVLPAHIRELYEEFKQDPAVLDLVPEIAQIRAWWGRFAEQFKILDDTCPQCKRPTIPCKPDMLSEMRAFADTVRKLVETHHKLEYGESQTLTIQGVGAVMQQCKTVQDARIREGIEKGQTAQEIIDAITADYREIGGKGE